MSREQYDIVIVGAVRPAASNLISATSSKREMEVAMVRDAVAAGNEEGDGYAAAMVNYRFMANAVWTTEETIGRTKAANR